jgi:hypothetical protein
LTYSSYATGLSGTFEKELALRSVVAKLTSRQLRLAKTLKKKYPKSPETGSSPDTDINSGQISVNTPVSENHKDLDISGDPTVIIER